MLIIDLMIIMLFIYSIVLLSGVKMMFNPKYFQIILFVVITYNPLTQLIDGYKLGYTGIGSIIIFIIVFLAIFIWGCRRNKYIYSIHNVKQEDVMNIIKEYLKIKNIKYEARDEEIYLSEHYKTIYANNLIEKSLNLREIKDMDFYNELVEHVRVGIKGIKKRYFPIEGMMNLIFVGIFYWIRSDFLVGFLK